MLRRYQDDDDLAAQKPLLINVDRSSSKPLEEKKERLVSLDAVRGITIWFMMLVNNADGSWYILGHSPWNGVTIADFVMPVFLFIVGASIALAFNRLLEQGASRLSLLWKAFVRAFKLFLLGLFLQGANFPYYDLHIIRIPGVLQRIALAYFVVSVVFLFTPKFKQLYEGKFVVAVRYVWIWVVAATLLIIYLGLLFGLNVPGCGRGSLSDSCNACAYIDEQILTVNHMYPTPTCKEAVPPCQNFDPEGILSTISATGSTFIGLCVGLIFHHHRGHARRIVMILPLSFVLLGIGLIGNYTGFPFNKNLYTTSYLLLCAGFAGTLLTLVYVLIDVSGSRIAYYAFMPFTMMGMNSIAVYFGDGFLPSVIGDQDGSPCMLYWGNSTTGSLGAWVWNVWLSPIHDVVVAHFVWALMDVTLWMIVAALLYWQKIFFKV